MDRHHRLWAIDGTPPTIITGRSWDGIRTKGGRDALDGSITRKDNVEAGVVLTTTTMTTTAMTTTTGGAAEMRDEVRDWFKALLERDGAEFAPLGGRGVPLVGIAIGQDGGGGRGADGRGDC
jgi:hypothetical protein